MKKLIFYIVLLLCSLVTFYYNFLTDRVTLSKDDTGYYIIVEKAMLSVDGYERVTFYEKGFMHLYIDGIKTHIDGNKDVITDIVIRDKPGNIDYVNISYKTPIDCDEHIGFEAQCRDMTQLYHRVYEEVQELYSKKVQQFEEKA